MSAGEPSQVWRRAVTGEMCWLGAGGQPQALPVIPLLDGDVPCVAVPYAHADAVTGLAEASEVAFAVTDSRSLPAASAGRAVLGQVALTEDTDGDVFAPELLPQELAKYPPSRTLADSPLLCRENWWWLSRIIVRLPRVTRVVELPARSDPVRHALLVRDDGSGLALHTVAAREWSAPRIGLGRLGGGELRGDSGPALVVGYDYSMPDLERWESWLVRGSLLGDELLVSDREGAPGKELGPLPLVDRIRRQRALAKACQRGIAAAER
ncbi:MAG: hypothetical protein GEU98_13360 [Pseudonocardiaceae bacterium]|nr:hypothetical protein [Pseudonocardiaceae bacterium]